MDPTTTTSSTPRPVARLDAVPRGPDDEGPWLIPDAADARARSAALDRIARAGLERPDVRALVDDLARAADRCGGGDARRASRCRADLALAWVQATPWRDPWPTREVYQGVARTMKHGGNCHDKSPLLVSLLWGLGFPTARNTWSFAGDPRARNHVLVQVVVDGADCAGGLCRAGWCWAETTVNGARVCEEPHAAQRRVEGARGGSGARAGLGEAHPARPRRALPPADGSPVVREVTVSGSVAFLRDMDPWGLHR